MLMQAPARRASRRSEFNDAPLRFDRRSEYRESASGRVVATFQDTDGQTGLTWMDVVDTSHAGIGLVSPVPIPRGAVVQLHPPVKASAVAAGWVLMGLTGLAVMCGDTREETGFRVGLRIEPRSAA